MNATKSIVAWPIIPCDDIAANSVGRATPRAHYLRDSHASVTLVQLEFPPPARARYGAAGPPLAVSP
jgi:hypothetical protein